MEFTKSSVTSPTSTASEESDETLADTSASSPTSANTTPTPSLPGEGDLDLMEGQSLPSEGTLPQEKDGLPPLQAQEVPSDYPKEDIIDFEENPYEIPKEITRTKEKKVVTPPLEDIEDPIFQTPTDPPKEGKISREGSPKPKGLGGEEGIPREPKPGCRPKPPLLRPPVNPIDRFWTLEVGQNEEELKTKPLFRLRLVERRKSVELSWTEVEEAETKSTRYDTVEPQSPSYVYAKRNRTHSLDLFVDAKKIPRGFIDVVCRDLKQAHADGKITTNIPKKKRGRKKREKPLFPQDN